MGCECPAGLWTVFEEDEESEIQENEKNKIAEKAFLDTESKLFQWLKENLAVERQVEVFPNSIVVGTTMEFDYEWAFFNAQAALEQQLGKHLSGLLELSEDGVLKKKNETVVLSAYL